MNCTEYNSSRRELQGLPTTGMNTTKRCQKEVDVKGRRVRNAVITRDDLVSCPALKTITKTPAKLTAQRATELISSFL